MESAQPSGVRTELHDELPGPPRADCAPGSGAGTQHHRPCPGHELTAFGGRNVGEAADVLYEMVTNPECLVVGTFSGAMTVAKWAWCCAT